MLLSPTKLHHTLTSLCTTIYRLKSD
uniref:Uncharacterized protein n=1 Tax=Anguilla anguilla TaxID=7936 RepID=A0A0E9T7V5_ANGAN